MDVYDAWHRVNALSAEDMDALQKELGQAEKAIKALQQKQMEQSLKNLSSY